MLIVLKIEIRNENDTTAAVKSNKDWLNEQLSNRHHLHFDPFLLFLPSLFVSVLYGFAPIYVSCFDDIVATHHTQARTRIRPIHWLSNARISFDEREIFRAGFSLLCFHSGFVPRILAIVRFSVKHWHPFRLPHRSPHDKKNAAIYLIFKMIMRQTNDTLSDA